MPPQEWDPDRYTQHASHIPERGKAVLELLRLKAGERVLDVGCGHGVLSTEMIGRGASVRGIDASKEMVAAARARGIDAHVEDAEHLTYDREFDAAFSNAALHWMKSDPDAVAAGIFRALRPGGRFVAEFGGFGNVAGPRVALREVVRARGLDPDSVDPWFFPSILDYRPRLERAGFRVEYMELFSVPTPLPSGMDGWLQTFGLAFLNALPPGERAAAHDEALAMLTPVLRDSHGHWIVDHVRLRLLAHRPE